MQAEKEAVMHLSLRQHRSEEVTHILERMPNRFGTVICVIVFVLVSAMLFFGWIIKYPDVLRGEVTINNLSAPVKLVSNSEGRLSLLTDTGKYVNESDYIAVIKNPAGIIDVLHVDSLVKNVDIRKLAYNVHRHYFPETVSIGEINQPYFDFLTSLYQYLDYYHEKPFEIQRSILQKQSLSQQSLLRNAHNNYKTEHEKYKLSQGFYYRDSILFHQKVISADEFEKNKLALENGKQQYEALERDITSSKYQIEETNSKIQQLNVQQIEKEHNLEIILYNAYYRLVDAIRQWEHKYVFVAPFAGKVEFLNFWKNNDYIEKGTETFSIIPETSALRGQVHLPTSGAGKIKVGQDVIVKLDDYPYIQFGSIQGRVQGISLIANQQMNVNNQRVTNYLVTISFPNSLKTNYGSLLKFRSEARGTAEIITEKRRLIERIFDNLKYSVH
ncbi:HlyD family efflux transporter periplasmic adaptor subunit [Danxiaibacter flavus]|uniref:HlyD family efflux transporter periplasmic adaptor subunit n=1 Tax=Danxiaibacter flavus TaxID=3049108 RepID=A0ABV3ZA04_9BACT|nr:HlyD family efflux transporter periplasmic adaptor subunit [Chitinophagaceae bacterium DXS]